MVDALVNKTSKKTLNILQGLKLLLQTLKHVGALQIFFKKTDWILIKCLGKATLNSFKFWNNRSSTIFRSKRRGLHYFVQGAVKEISKNFALEIRPD